MPRRAIQHRIERRDDLRLSPDRARTPCAGQKVRTVLSPGSAGWIKISSVFPVYVGTPPLSGFGELSVSPEGVRTGSLGQDTAGMDAKVSLSVLRTIRRSRFNQPSPVCSSQGGSHV